MAISGNQIRAIEGVMANSLASCRKGTVGWTVPDTQGKRVLNAGMRTSFCGHTQAFSDRLRQAYSLSILL
jgi:hypothetical protein